MDAEHNTLGSFVEAFRQVVIAKIACVPTDASDDTTKTIMGEITEEINTNDLKHRIVVEVIYSKAMLDSAWCTTAIKLLARLCDITSPNINNPNKEACPVLTPTCRHIVRFLPRRLCSTDTPALRLDPATKIDIMAKMITSEHLFVETNFDLLIHFIYTVGPNIDMSEQWGPELDVVLQSLQDGVSE
ncbi:hypothetical protein PtrSN002B_007959 [Pyrenophora tritici-repentis]|uniref:Uncharacterized protein n=2 Tax=Pyrenophora tritici-repentis TaxID=45151 RepID=A0A2W1D8P9_9PLEO|nr:uncharacterized protein PTRG_09801 [Pyrenophora tritici-repentis Pt-1C-BFP]KAA8621829.1 hypothetical protein PtrV1_06330 [Pyrenophora tritici-repentis]EDU42852.1 predicted protein [Pyrenophora tritici-repentis Pt-1C-BFP]KAF7451049.1 hypothetical protein A1F99_056650 [Pyrenophora tritici-repentis]KAF7573730.1 hypothetical protein PtrM4_086350 [Pyrenophora tritici-repentis]KAG9380735.1 hypothetical protein A1F94_008055 [Pyrenophora tritici-repentis]